MRQLPRLLRPRRIAADGGAPDLALESPRVEEVTAAGLRWYHVQDPGSADIAWLAGHFGFHPLDLEDVASINQRPKLDVYDDYLFLVVQFPRFDKETGRLHPVGARRVHRPRLRGHSAGGADRPAARHVGAGPGAARRARRCLPGDPAACCTRSWTDAWTPASRCSASSAASCGRLEDDIFEGSDRAEIVREISNTKQEIINFRAIIRPQRAVFRAPGAREAKPLRGGAGRLL